MEARKNPKYDLRQYQTLFFNIGLVLSLLMVIAAFEWRFYDKEDLMNMGPTNVEFVETMDVPLTEQPPPPPPKALKNVEIKCCDFSEVLDYTNKGDFVYFDPPYYPLNKTSNFTSYTDSDFLEDEQIRLFNVFKNLSEKEIYVIESNSDTKFIKNLYKEYDIIKIKANRFINSNKDKRGKINELFVKNFDFFKFQKKEKIEL